MKLGLILSNIEPADGSPVPRFNQFRDMAQRAEQVGFDSIWMADHLLLRAPGEDDRGFWEAFTFLGALAAVTSHIQLGTLVACTPFRNPALLARMADSIDEISGGRFILGLGAGFHEPEFHAFGYPYDHLVGRFEEALQVIVPLLRAGRASFDGRYYRVHEAVVRPRGPSSAGPPIWVGASGPRMLELTARYADGWNCSAKGYRASYVAAEYQRMLEVCERVGRDPSTLTLTAQVETHVLEPDERHPYDDGAMAGTPEEVAEMLYACAEVGVEHLMIIDSWAQDVAGIERLGQVLELVRGSPC